MLQVRTGIRSEEVRIDAEHVLFVEGSEDGSLDKAVIRAALRDTIRVEAMGPAYSVRSTARALARYHPNYYFVIDRDHHEDCFVEGCWRNFPDPTTDNLLVWRRREIENYFLDPPLLQKSKHCRWCADELERNLIRFAGERIFLDAANHVISWVREDQKTTWMQHFSNPADFSSRTDAVNRLISAQEFPNRRESVSQIVSEGELRRRFGEITEQMTGGGDELLYGRGRWVEMIRGKKVLSRLLNAGGFRVQKANGDQVTGPQMIRIVLTELAGDADSRPHDISELKRLVEARIRR